MWFFLTLVGYFLAAAVAVADKFILTKSVKHPVVYAFYSTIFALILFVAYPFGVVTLHGRDLALAIVSGVAAGFGIWTLFIATARGEASHIIPFSGAILTVMIAFFSFVFLHEQLSPLSYLGIGILVAASFLLSFQKTKKIEDAQRGLWWAVLAALLWAVSHTTAKYLYGQYSFLTVLVWGKATIGLVGIFCLCFPAVWQSWRPARLRQKKTFGRRHAAGIVAVNKVLGAVSILLVQYAIALSSVTVVNALAGAQYVCMFAGIYLLTRFRPKIFQEYFTAREIWMEMAGIVLVVLGSVLVVL